jgi:hypothetical protein
VTRHADTARRHGEEDASHPGLIPSASSQPTRLARASRFFVDVFFTPFFPLVYSTDIVFGGWTALRYKDTMRIATALEIGTQTRAVDER